jgi:hypothetical protein
MNMPTPGWCIEIGNLRGRRALAKRCSVEIQVASDEENITQPLNKPLLRENRDRTARAAWAQ